MSDSHTHDDPGQPCAACGQDWGPDETRAENAERIATQRIAQALAGLIQTYTMEGVGVWLFGRKRSLGNRAPIELLAEGDVDAFVRAVEALGDWQADRPPSTGEGR
jgi:hypothetical protein